MPTIAIVGAGPGLGLSIAKVFGGHGFEVALVSRNKDKLGDLRRTCPQSAPTRPASPPTPATSPSSPGRWRLRPHASGVSTSWSSRPTAASITPEEVTVENLVPQIDGVVYSRGLCRPQGVCGAHRFNDRS